VTTADPPELDPGMRIQTPGGCVPVGSLDPEDQRAMAALVAAVQRQWDAMPPEERAEVEARQAAARERTRARLERIRARRGPRPLPFKHRRRHW
jgi:acyl-CoA reductase-like NAD-dependent aldehyde dehydrogenase